MPMRPALSNSGTIAAQSGTLSLNGGGTEAGSALAFGGGTRLGRVSVFHHVGFFAFGGAGESPLPGTDLMA